MRVRLSAAVTACAVLALCGQSVAQDKIGETRVLITPDAQVLSTAHYQATASNGCSGSACVVTFPRPGAGKRLNATRVYCLLQASTNTPNFNYARVELQDTLNTVLMAQYINNVFKSASGTFTLNNPIDFQVAAGQHLAVAILLTAANADFAFCTISGTLSTLG
jgi:hypothetical protein